MIQFVISRIRTTRFVRLLSILAVLGGVIACKYHPLVRTDAGYSRVSKKDLEKSSSSSLCSSDIIFRSRDGVDEYCCEEGN